MIKDFILFVVVINLIIYFLVDAIVFSKHKNIKNNSDIIEKNKMIYFPDYTKNEVYDFKLPKEGKVKNIYNNKFVKINSKRLEKKYSTSIAFSSSSKHVYAIVAQSTSKKYYFANAYLNGYVPYKVDSVWQPLSVLQKRLRYKSDTLMYNNREDVWQTSRESFINLRGDCEDHAIVLADWLIGLGYDARIVIGEVQFKGQARGGHAWVILFDNNKEYLLEATRKRKWTLLPRADSLPYYFPAEMFNRKDIWYNKGSKITMKYSGENWEKTGTFIPSNPYYPDIQTHKFFVNTEPSDARVKILNIKQKFSQGIELKTGPYRIEISKEGYKKEIFLLNINSKDIHMSKVLLRV